MDLLTLILDGHKCNEYWVVWEMVGRAERLAVFRKCTFSPKSGHIRKCFGSIKTCSVQGCLDVQGEGGSLCLKGF